MNYDQNNPHWLHHPAWAGIGAIAGILALCFAIFIWFVPNPRVLFSEAGPTSSPSPTASSVATPTTNPPSTGNNQQEDRFGKTFDSIRSLWFFFLIIGFIPLLSYALFYLIRGDFSGLGAILEYWFYFLIMFIVSIIAAFAAGFLDIYFSFFTSIWFILILSLICSSIVFYISYVILENIV